VSPLKSNCRHGAKKVVIGLTGHGDLGGGVFVQTTCPRLLKCYEILEALRPYALQLLLRAVERTLSVKLAEVVVDAAAKAHLC